MIGIISPGVSLEGKADEEKMASVKPKEDSQCSSAEQDQSLQPKTVFDDPKNFNVVHPLQNKWQWWIDIHEQRSKEHSSWGSNIKGMACFDSVEGFWGTYKKVAEYLKTINSNYDCHLFKYGIRPEWEDPANVGGGRIVFHTSNQRSRANFDKLCLETLLLMIGDTLKHTEKITGCFISYRKPNERFCLWIREIESGCGDSICAELKRHLGDNIYETKLEKHNVSHGGRRSRDRN